MQTKTTISLRRLACLCLLTFLSFSLFCQINLHSNPTSLSPEESTALGEHLEDYTAYALNPQEVYTTFQNGDEDFDLILNLGEEMNFTFQLHKDDPRPSGYFLLGISEEEQLVLGKEEEVLLKGTTNDEADQLAYVYSTEDFFTVRFLINDEWYLLEPLESITGFSTFLNTYILYKKSDTYFFSNNDSGCLFEDTTGENSGYGHCEDIEPCVTSPVVEKDGIQRYLEVAVDVDVEFFNRYKNKFPKLGHLRSVEKVVLERLGFIDAIYQKYFDLHIKLVYLNIWQVPVVPPTGNYPYSSSNTESLWDSVRDYWNDEDRRCVHRDLFLLFSGKDISPGCGYINSNGLGTLCNANINTNSNHPFNAYAVIEDAGLNSYKTVAHEIAHLFGISQHTQNDPLCGHLCNDVNTSTLMCQGCGNQADKFIASVQCNIYSFLQNNDCFEDCAPTVEQGPSLQGPESICLGDEVQYEISIAPTGSVLWDLGPNLELISGTTTSTSISVQATAFGRTYIQATFSHNCFDAAIRKYIEVSGYEIREVDPMCFSEDCAVFNREGTYELFAACENAVVPACWAFSHPDDFYPTATQQDPYCSIALVAFPLNNLSNRMVTLYAYDPNDPSNLLSQKNIYIPPCETPCVGDREASEFSDQKKDQEKSAFTSDLFAFPNPVDDILTIQLPRREAELELSVLDIYGKVIFLKKADARQETIQLSTNHWTNGFYFIRLKTTDKNYLQGLVIQH